MNNQRLFALDIFRGFTIIAMITVNYPGSWNHVFAPLLHKPWHGLTPTDLIFPFFLFIVGVSIFFAYSKKLSDGTPKKEMYKKIIVRSIKIFGLGIFLNLFPSFNFEELRIAGVLQRIAIVFLFCSILFINTGWKLQIVKIVSILVVYCIAMMMIPTPGYDKAMLEPGINLAAWIDSKLLPGKMWEGSWDPEGILSTLSACATTISGMLVGRFINYSINNEKIIHLMVGGFVSCVLGVLWHYYFPINKPIWSSSYVLVTSGLATMVLGICLYLFDILLFRKWTLPCVVFGTNAIAAYFIAGVLSPLFYSVNVGGQSLSMHFFTSLTSIQVLPELASLLYAIIYVSIIFALVNQLYKRKIFIKL
jgi:predicted acyltransferase